MSLIHDSLRKLETKQVNELEKGSSATAEFNQSSKSFSAKNLWIFITLILGIAAIIYTYTMLNKYQKQNELLLKDINEIKSHNRQLPIESKTQFNRFPSKIKVNLQKTMPRTVGVNNEFTFQNQAKKASKVVIQKPATLIDTKAKKQEEIYNSKAKTREDKTNSKNIVQIFSLAKKQNKPIVTTHKKSNKNRNKAKLSIKQTRQLVNNLQLSIESGNQEKVDALLAQLAKSSGENSIVYLRMKAYYLTKTKDVISAIEMYKKILFQNPHDKQAVINSALIEAKKEQLPSAIRRLKALKKRYPLDKNIAMYLTRLEVNE
jgi:tetratricopeptide (TPR) repeat protein